MPEEQEALAVMVAREARIPRLRGVRGMVVVAGTALPAAMLAEVVVAVAVPPTGSRAWAFLTMAMQRTTTSS